MIFHVPGTKNLGHFPEFQKRVLEVVLTLLLFSNMKELIFLFEIHDSPGEVSKSLVFRLVYDLVQGPVSSFAEAPHRIAHITPAPIPIGPLAALAILPEEGDDRL